MQQFSILSLSLLNCCRSPNLIKSVQSNNNISLLAVFLQTISVCDIGGSVVAVRGAALYCCLLRGATEAIEYRGASHSKAGFATSVSAVKHAHCCYSSKPAAYFDGRGCSALARRAPRGGLMVAPACLGVARRAGVGV